MKIWAKEALTAEGWRKAVRVDIDAAGRIEAVTADAPAEGTEVGVLLPSPANLQNQNRITPAIAGHWMTCSQAPGGPKSGLRRSSRTSSGMTGGKTTFNPSTGQRNGTAAESGMITAEIQRPNLCKDVPCCFNQCRAVFVCAQ